MLERDKTKLAELYPKAINIKRDLELDEERLKRSARSFKTKRIKYGREQVLDNYISLH